MRLHWENKKGIVIMVLVVLMILVGAFGFYSKDSDTIVPISIIDVLEGMGYCGQSSNPNKCFTEFAEKTLADRRLGDVLEELASLESRGQARIILPMCHTFTHFLGRAAYREQKSIPDVYAECDTVCDGGCYHGAIEAHFKKKNLFIGGGDTNNLAREVQTVCGGEENYSAPEYYNECVHGIGHALMFVTEGELFQSLQLCDELGSVHEREYCYSGVFMENIDNVGYASPHPSRFVKAEDPLYPCSVLENKYLNVCYLYQGRYFIRMTNFNWEKTSEFCGTIPTHYRNNCFVMMGVDQVSYTVDLSVAKKNCDVIVSSSERTHCYRGVALTLVDRYIKVPSRAVSLGYEFCGSLSTGEDRRVCFHQFGVALTGWASNKEEFQTYCSYIPVQEYRKLCLWEDRQSVLD